MSSPRWPASSSTHVLSSEIEGGTNRSIEANPSCDSIVMQQALVLFCVSFMVMAEGLRVQRRGARTSKMILSCSDQKFHEFSEPSDCLFNFETFHFVVDSPRFCTQYQVARASDATNVMAAILEDPTRTQWQHTAALLIDPTRTQSFETGPCVEGRPTGDKACYSVDEVAWVQTLYSG